MGEVILVDIIYIYNDIVDLVMVVYLFDKMVNPMHKVYNEVIHESMTKKELC